MTTELLYLLSLGGEQRRGLPRPLGSRGRGPAQNRPPGPTKRDAQNRPRGPNQGEKAQNRPAGPIQGRGPQGPPVNPGAHHNHNDDEDDDDNGITMRRNIKRNDTEKQIGNHSRVAHTHDFFYVLSGEEKFVVAHLGCALQLHRRWGRAAKMYTERRLRARPPPENTSAP